ncbi:MAG: hypothetical protein QOJ01_1678 [Solirubrobacterales bacterium]|jgi:hypothetical protein|nr:hypothetical protein [Solirubrobacterales bacterium]
MTLAERIVAVHEALERAGIPHAIGGAIALAYWTLDPRGTGDIDVNVFVPNSDPAAALAALPPGVDQPDGTTDAVIRDGQVRLWWDETPVDLFFSNVPLHERAAEAARTVPFEGIELPVLGPTELAIFKAMFDRTRDWADIEAMLAAETLDVEAVRMGLTEMVGDDDPRLARLADSVSRAVPPGSEM